MIRIPANVILIWTGTNASIPSLWSRETTLDGKFPKAWGSENPNTTGGASTHTHTSPPHAHYLPAHTHTYTIPNVANHVDRSQNQTYGEAIVQDHTHAGTTASSSATLSGYTAVTYGAFSNNPPYHEVIFVKAGAGAVLNTNMVALWSSATLPTNWLACDGNSSTPDLRNKYLRGASTGADAGTTGGSYTNVHDITHTHTGASHIHGGSTTARSPESRMKTGGGSCCSVLDHEHTTGNFDSATATPDAYSTPLTTTETVEPAYKKLVAIQRRAGGKAEKGLIGLWLGTVASIPAGWIICDGNNGTPNMQDKFLKIANDTSEINTTGGSNTHTHGAQSHNHTSAQHRHLYSSTIDHSGKPRKDLDGGAGNYDDTTSDSYHPTFYTAYATTAFDSATTTADSSANQPEYRTCVYIYLRTPVDPKPKILEV